MVSFYKMARSGGTDIVAYSRFWRATLRGLESFDAFVDHVFANRDRLTSLPLELHPQAAFILDSDGALMVDRLFSLDRRRGLSPELERWLAIHPIPHLNATPPYQVDVTIGTRCKIEELYQTDFAIFEYVRARGGVAEVKGRRIPLGAASGVAATNVASVA